MRSGHCPRWRSRGRCCVALTMLSRIEATKRRADKLRALARPPSTNAPSGTPAEYIAASHGLDAPTHLQPLLDRVERLAAGETVQAPVRTPPQHGNSLPPRHALSSPL